MGQAKKHKGQQSQKFIEKARELGVDEQDDPLDRILERVTQRKPKDKKPDDDK